MVTSRLHEHSVHDRSWASALFAMDILKRSNKASHVSQSSQDHHDVQDLMAATPNIKALGKPFLWDLDAQSALPARAKSHLR